MNVENNLIEMFNRLVPPSGPASTKAGEIVRAINRINYRYYNDGDIIGNGYGNETCNAAARYLQENTEEFINRMINDMWGEYDDDGLYELQEAVYDYLIHHPELKTTPNDEDMFDYSCKEDYSYNDDEDDY